MKRAVIIHGYGGTPSGCWKPWLKSELEKRGFEVSVPEMPDTDYPKLEAWLLKVGEAVGVPSREVVLVGHSLGTPTILQYLARLSLEERIAGAVFVAGLPAFPEIQEEVGEFFAEEKIDEAKKHCGAFALIYSNNDRHVPIAKAEEFADRIGAEKIFIQGKGHFSDSDGVFELPEALQAILQMEK